MSDTDSLEYLQTGFDPSSLTVPRLRSILVAHNVDYPSGAKKPQLIQIFIDKVLPQSRKILNARLRAKRSSMGIIDADSSQESTVTGEEEDEMPPPPTPRARSTRKPSSRVRTDESESDVPSMRSPVKRTPRASSAKHARASDTETGTDLEGVRKSVRKTRRSEAPAPAPAPAPVVPQMRTEDVDDGAGVSRRESAFTYDNPFQSGSSPPPRPGSSERKRKSLGTSASKDLARRRTTSSSTSRRRTDIRQADDGFHPPTSATFEIPVSALNPPKDIDENGVEASEEFTAEEQLELVRERAANGLDALGPPRPKKKKSGSFFKGPLAVAALTLLGAYATWYRQEKVAVGYCGIGREATPVIPDGLPVPDWARLLVEPECELCPQNAFCSVDLQSECIPDFVKKPHPLSFGGLIPLPPTCEPDGEKFRKVRAVADRAVEELRERRAKFECGELTDEAGVPEPTVEIDAEELKKEMSKKRRKGMSEQEFKDLWEGAIGEIEKRDEVVSGTDGARHTLTSTSLARLPLGCAVRRSFRLALARHRLKIASVISFAAIIFYVRHALRSRAAANAAVPHLVSLTLDRLSTQAALHAEDNETYPESWISIGQLRDDVLREEHSIKKREALWSRVRNIVEMNANIRSSQREGRNGEISRVWEWIGAVGNIEPHERRRKSGRVSWGVYDGSPVSGSDAGPEVVQSKWQEGRPIY